MPEPGLATLIAAERTGILLRRDGAPFDFTDTQGELVRRGFESLVTAGLVNDGYDAAGREPVRALLVRSGCGSYELRSTLHDARPLRRRLFSPLRQQALDQRAEDLRNAVDTVVAAAQMLPMILAASTVTLGTRPDAAGMVPMVTDGRNVMRVPWSIFDVMGSSPRAQEGANCFKHLLEQDESTIVLVQGVGSGDRCSESAIAVAPGLWQRIAELDVKGIFEALERSEDPLPGLLTRQRRQKPVHGLRSDVGPRRTGARTRPTMPPPGPRL